MTPRSPRSSKSGKTAKGRRRRRLPRRRRPWPGSGRCARQTWQLASGNQEALLRERHALQTTLALAAPRPGAEALAAFPAGEGSPALALGGGAALLAGFLLGLPGYPRWRRRLLSGVVAAFLALLFYLGLASLLPDTRRPDILLALSGALLFITLRTLLRVAVLRRQRGPGAATP